MIASLTKLTGEINDIVWGPVLLALLLGVGLYVCIRTRFIQFSQFGLMCRETMAKIFRRGPRAEGDVTAFQAMTVAMGGTVGVGNIAGVAGAIAIGGPGAVFWMLVSGLIGMATKFAEVTLGVHYRKRVGGGPMMGGPMMYISRGLGKRWKPLAIMFCVFGALAGLGMGNMVQARAVAGGVKSITETLGGTADEATTATVNWVTGGVLLVSVGLVTLGGIKRIANVAMYCVPFMCTLYMLAAFVVIALYIDKVPAMLMMIVQDAFTPAAGVGGFAGATMMMALRKGMSRGVFSNEAGLGSAPIAHATARTDHPARQGLWGIFEVFFDTIVMCTATALVILLTGVWTSGKTEEALTIAAFSAPFGGATGSILVTFCMILTAYDTILAWCFYGESCCAFIFGHGRIVRTAYRLFWLPFILIGALEEHKIVWNIAEILNGLMALPNLIALLLLSGVVVKLTRGFLAGKPWAPPPDDDDAPTDHEPVAEE